MSRLLLGILGSTLLFVAIGCDGGSDLKEGVPKDVDMTKDYTPAAAVPVMDPKQQSKATAPAAK